MRSKLYSVTEIAKHVSLEKERGNCVVLVCGCFDLFHEGHLDFLVGSKILGQVLVVGVNSDASVERIKFRSPIFSADQRSKLVAALECVDYVFVFEEDTLNEAMGQIKPDIFAKGIDKLHINTAEEDMACELAIGVRVVGDSKKFSSSEILDRFLRRSNVECSI